MIEEKVLNSLKKYGNTSIAFSCIQENLNYYFYEDGFIAYKKINIFSQHSQIAVLGDPICAEENKYKILQNFITKYKHIFFVQINNSTKKILNQLNYYIFPFGIDYYINIHSHKISWKKKSIKKSINWQKNNNIKIKEEKNCDNEFWQKFKTLKKKFLNKKKFVLKTHSFLNRPLTTKEKNVRFFYLEQNNRIISFIRCDPIYKNKSINGYSLSYIIYDPEIKKNLTYGILNQLISLLKKEKEIIHLALGTAPYTQTNLNSLYLKIFQKCLFYLGSYFYNFKNLKKFKQDLATNYTYTYFASRKKVPIKDLLSTYCLTTGLEPK